MNDGGPKIVDIPERDGIKAAMENMTRHMDELIGYQKLRATQMRALYLSLREEGFTADEALALCWRIEVSD